MAHIAYIRVSSDKQTCSNQIFSIKEYAKAQNIKIDKWVEETISSKKSLEKRALGNLLNSLSSGDCVIITEVSRLARNLYELAGILQSAIKKDVKIIQKQKENQRAFRKWYQPSKNSESQPNYFMQISKKYRCVKIYSPNRKPFMLNMEIVILGIFGKNSLQKSFYVFL